MATSKNQTTKDTDLYIGVKNDLSPFEVDLNALTRGLVVVGQSGCGKSFLIGRLLEEIVRQSGRKTQLLVIDANSDFCAGLLLKARDSSTSGSKKSTQKSFSENLEAYQSGLLKNEFEEFQKREMKIFNGLRRKGESVAVSRRFGLGRGEPFNLPWSWLTGDIDNYLRIVKADVHPEAYPYTMVCTKKLMRRTPSDGPRHWMRAVNELIDLRIGIKREYKVIAPERHPHFPGVLDTADFLRFLYDIEAEANSRIWRHDQKQRGLPERLFGRNRVSFLEVETIAEAIQRIKVVYFVLEYVWNNAVAHAELVRRGGGSTALKNLKHTFILIDEAHNFAPEGTDDPHEKMLGELIHRIAAEGRKYGLHLILATQRPNKIKRGLLGECDNAIIMKMNSRSDLEHLAQEMRILDVKLLEPCLHFQGKGNCLAMGEMTKMAPYVQLFKSAPRRTVEGGVDIKGF